MNNPEIEQAMCEAVQTLSRDGRHSDADRVLHAIELFRALPPSQSPWIPCSDHARLPNCDDVRSVLGWVPGLKYPQQVSPKQVKHWALDGDPIPGAMWMPLPEVPKP